MGNFTQDEMCELEAVFRSWVKENSTGLRQLAAPLGVGEYLRLLLDGCLPIEHGDLKIDPREKHCFYEGRKIPLTEIEFKLLLQFMQHPNQMRTREQLCQSVWGYDAGKSLDVHISRLRLNIWGKDWERQPKPTRLETRRHYGYALVVE